MNMTTREAIHELTKILRENKLITKTDEDFILRALHREVTK